MPTRKKVTGLWSVTRNGPKPSRIWLVEMYIWTCWLPRRLSDAQRRGRTTHWVYRGDGGGRCPPRARTRRLARHLCRQHRSESDIFSPKIQGSIYLGNPMQTRGKVAGLWTVTRNGPDIQPSSPKWLRKMYIWTCRLRRGLSHAQKRGRTTHWSH